MPHELSRPRVYFNVTNDINLNSILPTPSVPMIAPISRGLKHHGLVMTNVSTLVCIATASNSHLMRGIAMMVFSARPVLHIGFSADRDPHDALVSCIAYPTSGYPRG